MRWHDQVEACTNAADVSAVWKYLKLYEKELYRNHYKHEAQTATVSTATHVSDEKRKGGWCWLLYYEGNREMASND